MSISAATTVDDLSHSLPRSGNPFDNRRSITSAVSWGAIVAGAAAAASLSLILLILGVGLGLSSVSPWAREGVSAATFGISTILWLTFTQLVASAVGGYLAGRLRTKWTEVHTDEVYFRDTAHGFLSWAVAALVTATLLTSAVGSIVGSGVQAGASMVGGVVSTVPSALGGAASSAGITQSSDPAPMAYFVDSLFRSTAPEGADGTPQTAAIAQIGDGTTSREIAEVSRIFMNFSRTEPLPPEDLRYVGQIVAQRTGLSRQAAEKRVIDVYARAQATVQEAETATREAADTARKASAYGALWLFVSLLIGAFVASLAATYGGRQRDA